jgi:apolipoprotein N-acyltransferase
MVQGRASQHCVVNSILLLLAGGAHALSVAWPFDFGLDEGQAVWWLQLASLVLLFGQLLRAQTWRAAAGAGWLFSLSSLSGTFWWIYISLHTYGGLSAILSVLAVLVLAGALALIYAAACWLYFILKPAGCLSAALVFAATWTLAELVRGNWLTGFPWGAGGYAHIDGWLAGYAPWIGVYGVGAVAAWIAATVQLILRCGNGQRMLALVLLALPTLYALNFSPPASSGPKLTVTLLQGNIPQDEKFQPGTGVPDSLNWYGAQLRAANTSLVVAPETAIPVLPQQLPAGYWDDLKATFSSNGAKPQAALIGIPLGSEDDGYTNSVLGLKAAQSEHYHYDKQHLVPFSEFTPTFFKWFTRMLNIPLGDFNRGALVQSNFDWQGQRLAPIVCYEDLFGEELGARFVDPAKAPTIFVNVSNLGWFGDSVAIDQHLSIARMRSLEFDRPTLRATNTGATVIIDHHGDVTYSLPRLKRAALVGKVQGRGLNAATGWDITPYAAWVSHWGLWPLWGLMLAVLLLVPLWAYVLQLVRRR